MARRTLQLAAILHPNVQIAMSYGVGLLVDGRPGNGKIRSEQCKKKEERKSSLGVHRQ